MNAAVVVWTPYQIMNTINFVMNDVEGVRGNIDLYLLDSQAVGRFYEPLVNTGLFRQVYLVRDYTPEKYFSDRTQKAIELFFSKWALKRRLIRPQRKRFDDYDLLIASGWAKYFCYLAAANKKARVVLTDDGMGSYTGDFRLREMPKFYQFLDKLTGNGPMGVKVSKMYVMRKDLMIAENEYPAENMPEMTDAVFETVKKVFSYQHVQAYDGKRIVYLAQPLEAFRAPLKVDESEIISVLQKYSDRTILRLHPRQTYTVEGLERDKSGAMWELLCRDSITDDSILIAAYSTAQITPKMVCDKAPTIIILRDLYFGKPAQEDRFIANFKKTYRGKIFVPETVEEFKAIMQQLCG